MHETQRALPLPRFYRLIGFPLLAAIVLLPYAMVLILSSFTGAYVDDILSPLSTSRAGYDGWRLISMYPQCGSGDGIGIPLSLLPGRAWAWGAHALTDNFYAMRLISVTIVLAWMVYASWLLRFLFFPRWPIYAVLTGIVCLMGLGTLPFAMLLNRPETGMIFAVTFFVSVPFIVSRYPAPSLRIIRVSGAVFFLITSWFLSSHPKAMFYVPLILVSAFYLRKWSITLGGVLMSLVLFTACQAWWEFWRIKTMCADSIQARNEWESATIPLALFSKNFFLFWAKCNQNIFESGQYITKLLFHAKTTWLPIAPQLPHEALLNNGIGLSIVIILVCIFMGYRQLFHQVLEYHEWKHPTFLLSSCLFLAAILQCALQSDKNFYNSGLIWITILLAAMTMADYLARYTYYWQERKFLVWMGYLSLCGFCGISQYALLEAYVPAAALAQQNTTPAGLIDNGMAENPAMGDSWGLISSSRYEEARRRILATAAACHIPSNESVRHIAVDIFTYLPFKASYQPYYLVFRLHEFDTPFKLADFLRRRQSSGLVTLCKTLPKAIVPYAKTDGEVCCLGQDQLDSMQQAN